MNYANDHFGHAYAGAAYGNVPSGVPFVHLVAPFMYVGEEVVRIGTAAFSATAKATDAVTRWMNERKTFKALSALEDHRLDDIGVSRDEIASVARKLAHG